MEEENKIEIKENGCKCLCQSEWFKKFLTNLSVGALLKGVSKLNSPDQIIIDLLNNKGIL